jgi:proline racemase
MLDLAQSFSVVDSHTAGHPTRVILSGLPPLRGRTVREQRDHFRARFDHLRPLILHEPRGHAAMVGLVPAPSEQADYGAFFISSYIYLDMCGHATIGFAKTLAASGQLSPQSAPEGFTLETPAGVVSVGIGWDNAGEVAAVRLRNVPSYLVAQGLEISAEALCPVEVDIAYGGMWYALIDARSLGLALEPDSVSQALRLATLLKHEINKELVRSPAPGRPTEVHSILFHEAHGPRAATHLVVLESNKYDRSPCGTGTSARLAQLHARGALQAGESYQASNILGVAFTARVLDEVTVGDRAAIVPEIEGNAHITAFSTILRERGDPLPNGFLCR